MQADLGGLIDRFREVTSKVLGTAAAGRRTLVVTHIDADGITSGSIVFTALMRKGANVALRAIPDIDSKIIMELDAQHFDYYIFTDLASTLVSELDLVFGDRYLVLDHHQLPEEYMRHHSVVNAWVYGFDGGRDACSASVAYLFASAVDPENRNLSPLAIIGAVADRQDWGTGRTLNGLNRVALDEACSAGFVTVAKDLLFTGRETRPIHEAIALTSTPLLIGLTGRKDSVLSILHGSGIPLKDGGTWRTISSLTPEEKMALTEVIASSLGGMGGATDAIANLVGAVYTLNFEDSFTPLHDAREFATLLNACGRMGVPSIGVAVCLGDRSEALKAAMVTLSEYRLGISRALESLTMGERTFERTGQLIIVRAEGVVDERLLGPVISIMSSSPGFKDKVIVGSSTSRDSELKISARAGDAFPGKVNLGLIMGEAAAAVGGVGGGHMMAAGARIPNAGAEAFWRAVAERIQA